MDSEYNLNRYLNIEAYIRKLEEEKRALLPKPMHRNCL